VSNKHTQPTAKRPSSETHDARLAAWKARKREIGRQIVMATPHHPAGDEARTIHDVSIVAAPHAIL
jgi:hypothetical protein